MCDLLCLKVVFHDGTITLLSQIFQSVRKLMESNHSVYLLLNRSIVFTNPYPYNLCRMVERYVGFDYMYTEMKIVRSPIIITWVVTRQICNIYLMKKIVYEVHVWWRYLRYTRFHHENTLSSNVKDSRIVSITPTSIISFAPYLDHNNTYGIQMWKVKILFT